LRRISFLLIVSAVCCGLTHDQAPSTGTPIAVGGGNPIVNATTFTISSPATDGQAVGTATASNSPTSWSISGCSNYLSINSSGNITVNATGAANIDGSVDLFNCTPTVTATSASGSASAPQTVNAYQDGFQKRPAVSAAQYPGLLTGTAPGGPAAFKCRPPWKVAGVDYGVGPPAGTTFKDPTDPANLPEGASYNAGTHILSVNSRSTVNLDAFDFCAANIEVYLRGASAGGGGALNVTNSKSCLGNNSSLFALYRSDQDAGTLTVRFSSLDGNGKNNAGYNNAIIFSGPLVFEYNYVFHVPFDGYNPIGTPTSGTITLLTSRFNLFYAVNYAVASHFDTHQLWGTSISNVRIAFNTMFQPAIADDGTILGPANSFTRIGDLNGGVVTTPSISYNTTTGPGQYLNVLQLTTRDARGTINTPSVLNNYLDASPGVIVNAIFYPSSASSGGILYQRYSGNTKMNNCATIPPA
jgi:hypothetical protein